MLHGSKIFCLLSASFSCALVGAAHQEQGGQCAENGRSVDAPVRMNEKLPFLPSLDMSLPFPVYYINMARSRKRRERIERTFGPLWDLHRFPAIDGANTTLVEELMGSTNYKSLKPFLYDTVKKEKMPGFYTLSNAEVGCILSHLLAVRQAYLAGHEMIMIIEDDLSPLLMPYWTSTIPELLREVEGKEWDTVQLGWLAGKNEDIYKKTTWSCKKRVAKKEYQYGMAAYVISKRGMEAVLEKFFVDKTPNGLIKPLLEPSRQQFLLIECYFKELKHTYVTMPALFPVDAFDTTVGGEKLSRLRLISYRLSNDKHIDATLELFNGERSGE